MPAAGTKAIEVNEGRKFLPAEEVELDQLIADGLRLQGEHEDLKERLATIKKRVAEIAMTQKGPTSTVHLHGAKSGSATVTWAKSTEIDHGRAAILEKKAPPAIFTLVFDVTRVFKLKRSATGWFREKQDRAAEGWKAKIAGLIVVSPKGTTVKFIGPDAKVEAEVEAEAE